MILARSPKFLKVAPNDPADTIDYVLLELYIWNNDKVTSKPVSPTYSLRKNKSGVGNYTTFEISELVRDFLNDYLNVTSGAEGYYQSNAYWVEWDATIYIVGGGTETWTGNSTELATNGWKELNIGFPISSTLGAVNGNVLLSNDTIYVASDNLARIPVLNAETSNLEVVFFKDNVEVGSTTITADDETSNMIKYITQNGGISYDNFKERVLDDSGTFENSFCNKDFFDVYDWGEADYIQIYDSSNNLLRDLNIRYVTECKHKIYKCIFVNKWGAFQDLYFFKKTTESLNVTDEFLKATPRDDDNVFTNTKRLYNRFNVSGKQSYSLNTGFITEEYNQVVKEMLMSESVWLVDVESDAIISVNPKTKDLTYKTSLNDKLINYTIDFDVAFDLIENFI